MRTLLGLALVIVLSACVADVEEEAPRDENASTEQPTQVPFDDNGDPRDPCENGLVFDDYGNLLSVPVECVLAPETDYGDPPPDAEGVAETSILPH